MKLLQGIKKIPTNDREAEVICQLFGLNKMTLKELKNNYRFTAGLNMNIPYNEKLADEADRVNEATNLI